MMPTQYLFLCLADHQLTSQESQRHGGSRDRYVRCLNIDGRWAVHGAPGAPLLVWHATQANEAHSAAERSTNARRRPVEVLSRSDSGWLEGREIQVFTPAFEGALLGHTAQSAAKVRRLRIEADKLEAFCLVVRQASIASNHAEFAEISRVAAKALHAKFGGGSITSASAWLAGRKGAQALQSVLAGEVELIGPLSMQEFAEIVALAQEAEHLRQETDGSNRRAGLDLG